MTSVKRKCLNLEEKVKAIRLHEKGISCKKISVEMGVGKTQIQNAVNNKVDILDKFISGVPADWKILTAKRLLHPEIDDKLFQWFIKQRGLIMPLTGGGGVATRKS